MDKMLPVWHKVVTLRDDLHSGELPLASFAADLYEVALRRGQQPIYEEPAQFFALTYPTHNLRELTRDVVLRLAGKTIRLHGSWRWPMTVARRMS